MIIIENTSNKTTDEVRDFVLATVAYFCMQKKSIWIHKEKEGREVAINTDDDPIRPGMLAYETYAEGGVDFSGGQGLWPAYASICGELGLV